MTKAQARLKRADLPGPSFFARMTHKICLLGPHYLGGGGVPVLLFPCYPSLKFPMFDVPQYCLFSPFSLKIWPLFPCTAEIKNALFHWYPNPLGWPHITVSIILFGTVTIKVFTLDSTYISVDFPVEHI